MLVLIGVKNLRSLKPLNMCMLKKINKNNIYRVVLLTAYVCFIHQQQRGIQMTKMVSNYRIYCLAEQLLIDRHAKIETLCYKSGFNSPSYASKQFKLIKGVTPAQYRGVY